MIDCALLTSAHWSPLRVALENGCDETEIAGRNLSNLGGSSQGIRSGV
jgi:hypothetical protein